MPFYLEEIEEIPELDELKSVLIIPCRFCPAASLAVSRNKPYFEFYRRFLKTASYEQFIKTMKSGLERKGIRTGILRSHLPHQFVLCCWTSKRRQKLLEYVDKYEAILVLGCEAAVKTVHDTVKSTSCRVFQGMKTIGVMSIKPRFHLPCNISLEIDSLTPMIHQEQFSEAEIGA
jgi:hypothetical protein